MSSPARPRRRASLRTVLVALLLATVAVMCLVIGVVTHVSVRDQLSAQLDAQLSRASDRATHGTAPQGGEDHQSSPPLGGDPGGGEFELSAVIIDGSAGTGGWRDEDGDVLALSAADLTTIRDAVQADDPAAGTTEDRTAAPTGVDVHLSIGDYRVVATTSSDGTTLVTGLPLAQMHSTLTRLDLTLLGAGLGAMVVTGVAGSLIVRRTMRPLEEVSRLASQVAEMPLSRGAVALDDRIPADRAPAGTEVGEVARALNHLLDNVEGALETRQASEERMRRFVADASHELRTPLTAIRGYTEMLRLTEELSDRGEQSVDRLDAQSRRMTSLVEDLLLLARLDDGAPRADEEVDLGELVVEAVLDAQVTGRDHRWTLEVPEEPVLVRGDPRQLAQVIVNLLSNARKHTPAGTAVTASLREAPAAGGPADGRGRAVIEIADDGPGIAPALLGEVFSRFTRADAARSGTDATTGLGLSIVRAIVVSHGGEIAVTSAPGRTVFTVRLPLAVDPGAPGVGAGPGGPAGA
ncbi:ATP-binding protein [Brachybacterium sp. AOP25-B2-12]|uniref:ATP-binding protein n=1 Tax=Brachybacterium sp. AOP25-B2-12 TaxID=3457710 RepID=UPI004033D4C8